MIVGLKNEALEAMNKVN